MGPWENPPFTRRTEVIVRPRKTDQVRANITDKEMHLQQKWMGKEGLKLRDKSQVILNSFHQVSRI